jgi:hypothetical protein
MIERHPTIEDERTIIEASTLEESMERAERLAGVMSLFRRGMDRITQPVGFNAYVHLQARFPEQPFSNVLLLLEQQPETTQLASSPQWDATGRPLRPGERGIWLFVPYERETGLDGTGEAIRELIGVGVETVYDIAQTKGPIYREEPPPPPLSTVEVQERVVRVLIGNPGAPRDQRERALVSPTRSTQTTLKPGQLGLGLSFEPAIETEHDPKPERLLTLIEVLRERLIRRGRLSEKEIDHVARATAAILMIQHGVELGEIWIPELVEMIQDWSITEPHLTEIQTISAVIARGDRLPKRAT